MNVVSYIRVSGKGQLDGDGPDRQRDSVNSFVDANKLVLKGEFFERAVSGTAANRPEFSAMIDLIERSNVTGSCAIHGIVIERLDRLARDLMVQEFLLKECRDRGIKVFAVDVGIIDQATNDGDPTRKLIRQVLGAVAEFAKSELVMKMAKARARIRAEAGRCEGRKPFGFRPAEKEILSAIVSYRELNLGFGEIAEALNLSGALTRTGARWNKGTVFKMWKRTTGKVS